jgi:hypothetical protein
MVPAHEIRRAEGIDRRFAALFVGIIAGVFSLSQRRATSAQQTTSVDTV